MRRRKHQQGISVLVLALLASAALNILIAFPLFRALEGFLATPAAPGPVRVVKLSTEQWSKNRHTSGPSRPAFPKPTEAAKLAAKDPLAKPPEKKVEEPKKEEPKVEDKLTGQVVEVPPSADDSPNPEAKYLSKYNVHVEKETTARPEDRNPNMKRVTNKLQTVEQRAAEKNAIVVPNLSVKGDGQAEDKDGTKGAATQEKSQKFVLEVPDLSRRDQVQLKLGEGAGLGSRVSNRTGTEAMKGNASSFNLQLGAGTEDIGGENGGGKKGSEEGGEEEKKSLPTLAALVPTIGTVSRLSGSPSRDHVDGVPEGDGTFLNTKEFKYATFFYRVRDSVASYWDGMASSEYRRRDPTGNIYGIRDRSTLLQIKLSRDGKLSDVRVEQTSGVDFLDHVAVEAFRKAQPFPNPPTGIMDEDGNIRFNFQFVVTMRRSPLNFFEMK